MAIHQITRIIKADRRAAGDLSYLKATILRADTGAETAIDLRSRKGEAPIPVNASLTAVALPDDFFAGRDADAVRYRAITREKNGVRLATLRRRAEAEIASGSHDIAFARRIIEIIDAGLPDEEMDLMAQEEGSTQWFPVERIVIERARVA